MTATIPEQRRLDEEERRATPGSRWRPYVPERQWGTVRENCSKSGSSWDDVAHEHARTVGAAHQTGWTALIVRLPKRRATAAGGDGAGGPRDAGRRSS